MMKHVFDSAAGCGPLQADNVHVLAVLGSSRDLLPLQNSDIRCI